MQSHTMKKTILLSLFSCVLMFKTNAQSPSMKAWDVLLDKKVLVDYYKGTFERLGVYVDSTNEAFTVVHLGEKFNLENGIDSSKSDYIIKIKPENVRNLRKHGIDGVIDANEAFKIQAAIFTPISQSMFSNKEMNTKRFFKASKVEDHMQVILLSNDQKVSVAHTILWVNEQWMVIPGLHGKAKRVFTLNPEQALFYQRKVFAAQKENTVKGWKVFLKWYHEWKNTVSKVNK